MKVKIIKIHSLDAWHDQRSEIIGTVGEFDETSNKKNGWSGGNFIPDIPFNPFGDSSGYLSYEFFFAHVKYEKVQDDT